MNIKCVPQKQKITAFSVKNMKTIFRLSDIKKQFLQETSAVENKFYTFEPFFVVEKDNLQHRMTVFVCLKLRGHTQLYRSIDLRFCGVYVESTILFFYFYIKFRDKQ